MPRHTLPKVVEAMEAEMAKIVEPTGGEPATAEDNAAVEHEPVTLKTHTIPAELITVETIAAARFDD